MPSSRETVSFPRPEVICLAFLILYFLTAAPSLGWRDAPEFAITSYTLGIAHPAGFPTYSLLSKVLTFLPLGSIPFRVTLFSVLMAVFCLYLLYLLVERIAAEEEIGDEAPTTAAWAAATATLVFGLTRTVWGDATGTEVYVLHLFFIAITLYAGLRWSSGGGVAWLYAGGFLYGLAAGNHGSVAFYLPAFLVFFFLNSREDTWRCFISLIFFFLVGFSVYLYLPLRSATDPTIDWGNPETWSAFWRHITDRKDASYHFQEVREGIRFFDYVKVFLSERTPGFFWPLGLPLIVLGFWRMVKIKASLAFCLSLVIILNLAFFIRWVLTSAFLPTYFCLTIFWGLGLAWLLRRLRLPAAARSVSVKAGLTAVLCLVFAGGIWLQFPTQNRSASFLPLELFREDYEMMAPDAVSLTAILWFHHRAYQDIFRLREDAVVIGLSDFVRPDYFNPVTPDRFPRVVVPPGDYTSENGVEYLKRFVAANLDQDRDIYWEPIDMNEIFYPNLRPELNILFKFTRRPVKELPQDTVQRGFDRLRAMLKRQIEREGMLLDKEVDAYYVDFLAEYARYLRLHGRPTDSISLLKMIQGLFGPTGKNTLTLDKETYLENLTGVSLLDLGRVAEAEALFKKITERNKYYYDAIANLGMIYLKTGRLEQAKAALTRAVELGPGYPEAYVSLGQYYRRVGDTQQARKYFNLALQRAIKSSLVSMIKRELASLSDQMKETSP
ncbi:MAG: DUF2723 domain-containing protein [Deltaproteobacteria bacterium]|nr:DUF2723 domain-containing protein [Deltaproteobacteria bacterium]